VSGQYHVELRPRSLRSYTMESRHKTLRNVLLYPRKRKCAAQNEMSALGQKQTCAAHSQCPLSANSGLMHRSKQHLYSITSSGAGRPRCAPVTAS
jgi:hypothetical protein